jgi:aspartyl-tRNA(Asn)/glutamyl-tRNA(Gln) amidotransferase subunit A
MTLHTLSAKRIAADVAARRLSPVELVQALIDRAAQFDPLLNVYIRLDAEAALEAARVAEREAMQGRLRGPLHGVPVGIKDIIDVAGLPTTAHSRILLDNVATEDAVCVARLRAAGGIVMGKLSTHEFALGGPAFDLPFPPARNPWDRARHPGGSSSGSGAGLAAGFFPLALGTDTAGSIRNPASCCGVVGLKPTTEKVPRQGVFPLAWSLDTVGPMARHAADAALLLDAIAGTRDAGSMLGRGVHGLRIGFVRHFHERDMPADPQVIAALEAAAQGFAKAGALVSDAVLPDLNLFAAVNRTILNSEAWSVHAEWLRTRPEDYSASTRSRLLTGAFIRAGDYVLAQRYRARLIAQTEAVLAEYDVLLCASAMDPPCGIDDAEAIARSYPRQARSPFNVTGHPALAMLAGVSTEGLPLSLQLVAGYDKEAMLLRVAEAWEEIGGRPGALPPLPIPTA